MNEYIGKRNWFLLLPSAAVATAATTNTATRLNFSFYGQVIGSTVLEQNGLCERLFFFFPQDTKKREVFTIFKYSLASDAPEHVGVEAVDYFQ